MSAVGNQVKVKRSTVRNILILITVFNMEIVQMTFCISCWNVWTCELFGYFVISQWARTISWEIKWLRVTITSVNRCEYFVILVYRLVQLAHCLEWTYKIIRIHRSSLTMKFFARALEKIAHGNKEKTKQSVGLSSMSCSKVKKLELKFDSVWYPMRPMKYVVSTNKIVLTEEFHWVWFIRWYWLGVFVFQILKISHWKNIHASSAAPAPSNL